jgi:microcystin-dependent protein
MDPFLGQIQAFGFNFPPQGWAFCDGQLISIAQNTALFALLGTTYGGNGQTTFALPDLRGRSIVHPGTGPGLPNVQQGEASGFVSATILTSNMPAHTHAVSVGVILRQVKSQIQLLNWQLALIHLVKMLLQVLF